MPAGHGSCIVTTPASAASLHVERRAAQVSDKDQLPLVMLHGWGMNLRVFDLLREDLAARETWAIDLPGHGRSPWWPEATDFEEQVRVVLAVLPPRCILVGWSFGAKLSMAIAVREPQRIAALVLLSASPKFARSTDWPHGMEAQALRAFRVVLEQDWQQTLSDFIALQLRGSRNAEAAQQVIEAALAGQGAPHRDALIAGMALLDSVDLRPLVPRIAQPTLIVVGQNDRVTLPGATRWLAAALPDARFIEVSRAGHAPFVSHHEEVAAAMRAFLAELQAEA
jgi:pimeloyl-[acyl-carrier protein] methyl ester esterase